jgi:aminoglycoside 3-N-acetyltransferase
MLEATYEQVVAALVEAGVQPGDGLLVHSALQFLGRTPEGPKLYLQALFEILGPQGTLAVPAFNFGFARGQDYDPAKTPSDGMGVFSEYVRTYQGAMRTPHPMQSLSILWNHAADLAARDTPSAFEPGSAFEHLLELDFKLLLLGAGVQACSMVHYSEGRASVPYRYWKAFTGRVRSGQAWETRTYRMFVRDLVIDPQLDLSPIQRLLEERGQWRAVKLNYGWVSQCRLRDFVAATDDLLSGDVWALVVRKEAPGRQRGMQ